MGVSSILPVLPLLADFFNVSEAMLGIFIYAFTLPGIFLAPVGGILADRFGRKTVLIPCLILFALSGFFASLTTSIEFFIFWRILQGCGAACLGVLYSTIIGDIYTDDNLRLVVMGRSATVLSLGAAIFPAFGGLLGELGWAWSLRLSLIALPIAAIGMFAKIPPVVKKTSMKAYASEMKGYILHRRALLHFALTLCAFCILYGPMVTYFPLFTSLNYSASPMQIGILFAASSLGTAFASLFLSPLSKLLKDRLTVCLGVLFFILCMLCLYFWKTSLSLWLLTIPILCYGLGQGLSYTTIMNSLTTLAPSNGRGMLMAVNGTILRLAQSIAPFICGYLFLWGSFSAVFIFGLLIATLMLYLAYLAYTPK